MTLVLQPAWRKPCGQALTLLQSAELAARQAEASLEKARSYFIVRGDRLHSTWLPDLRQEHVPNMPLPLDEKHADTLVAVYTTSELVSLTYDSLSRMALFIEEISVAESKDWDTSRKSRRMISNHLVRSQSRMRTALCSLKSIMMQQGILLRSAASSIYPSKLRALSDVKMEDYARLRYRRMRDYLVLRDGVALLHFHAELYELMHKEMLAARTNLTTMRPAGKSPASVS